MDEKFGVKKESPFENMKKLNHRSYFFDDGILFECLHCGACCTGEPGTVYVSPKKLVQIAHYLSMEISVLTRSHVYPFKNGFSIKEREDGQCYFYNDGCRIYPVRPLQCRIFPFWFENLRSRKQWNHISGQCPGIGRGKLYSKEKILKIVQLSMKEIIKSHLNGDF